MMAALGIKNYKYNTLHYYLEFQTVFFFFFSKIGSKSLWKRQKYTINIANPQYSKEL